VVHLVQAMKERWAWSVGLLRALTILHDGRCAVAGELSKILNTGLDRETLTILINLCEAGVNPEALALGE
jgi:hypothetical protein